MGDDKKTQKANPSLQAVSDASWVEYSSIWHPSKSFLKLFSVVSLKELLTGSGGAVW